jgi:cysteine desulfurase, sufS subfamily
MKTSDFKYSDAEIRKDFPLISQTELAYLDNAATSQKPYSVLEAVRSYYEKENANPMRGLYDLSVAATEAYERARKAAADFIKAPKAENIVFTRNASESLNLIAYTYGMEFINEGDEILVSITEHHSNFLPWQNVAKKKGALIKFLECDEEGYISVEALKAALSPKIKLVAITQVSNVLGRENPIREFAREVHKQGAVIVLDGAQSVPHTEVDVQELDVDFLAFSGHKLLAPMGIGVLYGKTELLEKLPPFLYGGEMIESVSREKAVFAQVPHKFEAGTVNAGGAVGLAAAIDYINRLGFDEIKARELYLTGIVFEEFKAEEHIHIVGSQKPEEHHGIVTFTVDEVHPHDIAQILSSENIAIRAGHHCAQPLINHLGMMSAARASLAFYNTEAEIRRFCKAVKGLRKRMGYGR